MSGIDESKYSNTASLSYFELSLVIISATLMTGINPNSISTAAYSTIKLSGYLLLLAISARIILPILPILLRSPRALSSAYSATLIWPLGLYFAGQIIGASRGPSPIGSLWQVASDAIVFIFAIIGFGWIIRDPGLAIFRFLKIIAIWSGAILLVALPLYIGNIYSWWCINRPAIYRCSTTRPGMNGFFNNPLVLAYILMTGALAAGTLAVIYEKPLRKRWALLCAILTIGELLTFGRGAILGTAVGLIGITAIRHRRGAIFLSAFAAFIGFVFASSSLIGDIAPIRQWIGMQEISTRSFDILEGLSDEEWQAKLREDEGRIVLPAGGSTTSEPQTMKSGRYSLVVESRVGGYEALANKRGNDIPALLYTIVNDGKVLNTNILRPQLGDKYLIGSPFILNDRIRIQFILSFEIDKHANNYRYVIIEHIYLVRADWHLLLLRINDMIPKVGLRNRDLVLKSALNNLRSYGPLGVGAGNAESLPGLSTHNFWLEQYGEGGVLTVLGVLGWLILPIVHLKRSRLPHDLAWAMVAMMAGLMVHGLFWTQFLNGLRFLTLVYVCLWTALATQRTDSIHTRPPQQS